MADRTRVLLYVAALVAAFALAFVVGRLAAPYLSEPEPDPGHRMGAAAYPEEPHR
jgi:hypothetical protein